MFKHKSLVAFFIASLIVLCAPRARACNSGGGSAIGALIAGGALTGVYPTPEFVWTGALAGAGVADLALSIVDLRTAARHQRPRRTDGIAEIVTTIPAIVLGATTAGLLLPQDSQTYGFDYRALGIYGAVEAAWATALFAHGIWAAAAGTRRADVVHAPEKVRVSFAPTLVTDGTSQGAGLAAVGRF
jgi:hypothetical protein